MAETALITGASSGLGLEYARLFAADKKDLVLVARRRERLESLANELSTAHGEKVYVIAEDLRDPAAPRRIFDEVKQRGLAIEYLVNNAGFGTNGAFTEAAPEKELDMVQVNVAALVALTRAFVPEMVRRGHGRVLNIGSTAGFQPGPFMAVYYASKAFVNSFTEALSYELKGTGVTATVSCPGPTATEFGAVAGNDKSLLFKMGAMSAAQVAREGFQAMLKGKPIAVHGFRNKLLAGSVRFSPRSVVRGIAASINKPSGQKQTAQLKS
jgi:short-subunit dehydrogenase